MSKIRQSDIIAITVSVIVALLIAVLMIRSTRKTLRDHARHTAEREYKYNDKSHDKSQSHILIGGGSKTTTGIYLLFAGVFIGYILSHFR
jgi:mannitol-specific phosphotransferase system IIBC component